jgi:hypothetical protein
MSEELECQMDLILEKLMEFESRLERLEVMLRVVLEHLIGEKLPDVLKH